MPIPVFPTMFVMPRLDKRRPHSCWFYQWYLFVNDNIYKRNAGMTHICQSKSIWKPPAVPPIGQTKPLRTSPSSINRSSMTKTNGLQNVLNSRVRTSHTWKCDCRFWIFWRELRVDCRVRDSTAHAYELELVFILFSEYEFRQSIGIWFAQEKLRQALTQGCGQCHHRTKRQSYSVTKEHPCSSVGQCLAGRSLRNRRLDTPLRPWQDSCKGGHKPFSPWFLTFGPCWLAFSCCLNLENLSSVWKKLRVSRFWHRMAIQELSFLSGFFG